MPEFFPGRPELEQGTVRGHLQRRGCGWHKGLQPGQPWPLGAPPVPGVIQAGRLPLFRACGAYQAR